MDYSKSVLLALIISVALAYGKSDRKNKDALSQWSNKGLSGIWNDVTAGLSNFANVLASVQSVLSVLNENKDSIIIEDDNVSPDTFLHVTELGAKYGYTVEEHKVTTEDGYILTIHRLKGGNSAQDTSKVVFLMHGIVDSSDSWLLQGPDNALGYILADNNFDVWMGNARGNKYSLAHTKLDRKENDFWEFTWEEIGIYDLPAMIDYVLKVTKKQSLYYIGYSQGTTIFYVMSSMKPEYNEKVKMMFSLAPVAWMSNVKSPLIKIFSPAYNIIGYLLTNFNIKSSSTEFFNKVAALFCSYLQVRCGNLLNMIGGYDYKNINSTLIPVILGHMPTGASTLQFVHYGQLVASGRFARYDFGSVRNFKHYSQLSPPDYDLAKVSVPIQIFYSDRDWLSAQSDVQILKEKLPNVVGCNFVKGFHHLDYTYAAAAKTKVYNKIIRKIYEKENEYDKIDYKEAIQNRFYFDD